MSHLSTSAASAMTASPIRMSSRRESIRAPLADSPGHIVSEARLCRRTALTRGRRRRTVSARDRISRSRSTTSLREPSHVLCKDASVSAGDISATMDPPEVMTRRNSPSCTDSASQSPRASAASSDRSADPAIPVQPTSAVAPVRGLCRPPPAAGDGCPPRPRSCLHARRGNRNAPSLAGYRPAFDAQCTASGAGPVAVTTGAGTERIRTSTQAGPPDAIARSSAAPSASPPPPATCSPNAPRPVAARS